MRPDVRSVSCLLARISLTHCRVADSRTCLALIYRAVLAPPWTLLHSMGGSHRCAAASSVPASVQMRCRAQLPSLSLRSVGLHTAHAFLVSEPTFSNSRMHTFFSSITTHDAALSFHQASSYAAYGPAVGPALSRACPRRQPHPHSAVFEPQGL